MNWYDTLKFAASPKNIINQWKVDDPFLKFFIYTYEPKIDLSKIKSQEDLKTHIQQSLIPSLKEKITMGNPNSYYLKEISDEEIMAEINEHANDPRIARAIEIFKRDPKQAKEVILTALNEDKKLSFDKWWKYMEQDYGDNPAFFYSMLNPMIEKSPPAQKNGPPPAHREAVEQIKDEIGNKGVTSMNVFKKFNKTSFDLDKERSEVIDIDKDKGWIRIDSKLRDRDEYKSNQEKLMRFSTGSGWCIARESHSNDYLSQGDFWLYFENKRPKAAIRLIGDKKVEEIRGLYNKEKTLDPLWEPVTTFLHNTDFDYKNNSFYTRLKDIMYKNVDLENNPEAYQSVLKAIEADPKQLGLISKENRAKFPELVETAAVGYEKRMNVLLDAVEKISPTGNEYQKRFSQFQDEFNDIPKEVKPHLSDNIEGRLASVHKNAFLRNPLEYEFFPEDMKAIITSEDKKTAWIRYVGNDPYRYNDTRMDDPGMEGVRQHIPIGPIVEGWDRLINLNIAHVDNIPSFILGYLPENYVENKIIEDFKKYPNNRDKKGFDKLRRVQERGLMTEEEIMNTYLDSVQKNPNIFRYAPPQYQDFIRNNLQDISPLAQKNLSEVISDASYFNAIMDEDIKNYLLNNHRQQIITSFINLRKRYGGDVNGYWKAIPEALQPDMPDYIKEEVANFWLPYVQKNPSFLNKVPIAIQQLVTNKLSYNCNWYRKIRA